MLQGTITLEHAERRLPGMYVTNGEHIVLSDKSGHFTVPWVTDRHRFVALILPDGFVSVGRWWYHAQELDHCHFSLRRRHARAETCFRAIHVTDFHMVEPDRDAPEAQFAAGQTADYPRAVQLKRQLDRFIASAEDAEFIIATGDLTNCGDEQSLRAVSRVFRSLPIQVFPVFGGHDGNVERGNNGVNQYNVAAWSKHLAPPYYSWNWGGRHFLSFVSENTNYLDPVTQQMHDAFVEADLRIFGRRYPVTVCSHKHPYPWNEAIFHRYRVDSWLHGHFHCNRVNHQQKIRVFSTCPPAFGALDSDVIPARGLKFEAGTVPVGQVLYPPHAQTRTRHRSSPRVRRRWKNTSYALSHLAAPCITARGIVCGLVDDAAGENGGVVCIDEQTGTTNWMTRIRGSIQSPVASGEGKIIAATHDGLILCMSSRSGRVNWRYQMPEQHDRWIYSPPVLKDNRVIVGTTSCLVCLDPGNGKMLWEFRSPTKSSDAFGQFQRASIVDGKVFLAGYRTGSYLLSLATGEVLLKNDDDAMRYSSRVADDLERYLIGDNAGWLTCFDPHSGVMRWRERISQNIITSAFVPFLDGLLGGAPEGLVYCAHETGKVLARRGFGIDVGMFVAYRKRVRSCPGTPAVIGDRAWVASGDGYLNLIEGPQLKLVDRLRLRSPIISGLAITPRGNIYGVSLDGTLHCFTHRRARTIKRRRMASTLT